MPICIRGLAGGRGLPDCRLGQRHGAGFQQIWCDRGQHGQTGQDLQGADSRWPKGKPITFFSLNPAATEMKVVLEKVYGMSSDEVTALISNANHGRANHPAIVVVNSD